MEGGGVHTSSKKVAIYLIFPTTGVQGSHLSALDYIIHSGYSPLVVSNLFLNGGEREELRNRCWQLIERPNFGYDFGGYRDGILHLAPGIHDLERLVLLNDSCWFPVPRHADWIHAAEQLGTDLAGAVANGLRIGSTGTLEKNERGFHYGSFALMFSRNVLKDPGFLQFWHRLRLTNDKIWTVKRGEVGCTRWIIQQGYSHAATCDVLQLGREFDDCEPTQLLEFIRGCMPVEPVYIDIDLEKSDLIRNYSYDDGWKRKAIAFLRVCIKMFGFHHVFPNQFAAHKEYGFLKKTLVLSHLHSRDAVVQIAERHKDNCDFDLLGEICGLPERSD